MHRISAISSGSTSLLRPAHQPPLDKFRQDLFKSVKDVKSGITWARVAQKKPDTSRSSRIAKSKNISEHLRTTSCRQANVLCMFFSRNWKKIHGSQKEHGIPRYTPGIPIGSHPMEHKGAKEINRMHLGIGLHHEVEVHSVTVSCRLWRIFDDLSSTCPPVNIPKSYSYGNPWVCPLNPLFNDLCMVDFPHPSSSHIYVRLRMLQLEVVNIVNLCKPYNSTAWMQDAAALLSSNHLLAMTTSPRCHDKNDDPTMSTKWDRSRWGAEVLSCFGCCLQQLAIELVVHWHIFFASLRWRWDLNCAEVHHPVFRDSMSDPKKYCTANIE